MRPFERQHTQRYIEQTDTSEQALSFCDDFKRVVEALWVEN
jgi:hypothetical protein